MYRAGAHVFRRTAATWMVRRGATFKEVADVLPCTPRDYGDLRKLDLRALLDVALPRREVSDGHRGASVLPRRLPCPATKSRLRHAVRGAAPAGLPHLRRGPRLEGPIRAATGWNGPAVRRGAGQVGVLSVVYRCGVSSSTSMPVCRKLRFPVRVCCEARHARSPTSAPESKLLADGFGPPVGPSGVASSPHRSNADWFARQHGPTRGRSPATRPRRRATAGGGPSAPCRAPHEVPQVTHCAGPCFDSEGPAGLRSPATEDGLRWGVSGLLCLRTPWSPRLQHGGTHVCFAGETRGS